MTKRSLGKWPFGAGGGCTLMPACQAGLFHRFQELTRTVSGITVNRRLVLARCAALTGGQQVSEQADGRLGVPAVARRDGGSGDDLTVRVDRGVAFVPIKAAGGGLPPVTGLRSTAEITRSGATRRAMRNTPSASCSRSWPVIVANSWAACPAVWSSSLAVQSRHDRPGVFGAGVDQLVPGRLVVLVDLRFGRVT